MPYRRTIYTATKQTKLREREKKMKTLIGYLYGVAVQLLFVLKLNVTTLPESELARKLSRTLARIYAIHNTHFLNISKITVFVTLLCAKEVMASITTVAVAIAC